MTIYSPPGSSGAASPLSTIGNLTGAVQGIQSVQSNAMKLGLQQQDFNEQQAFNNLIRTDPGFKPDPASGLFDMTHIADAMQKAGISQTYQQRIDSLNGTNSATTKAHNDIMGMDATQMAPLMGTLSAVQGKPTSEQFEALEQARKDFPQSGAKIDMLEHQLVKANEPYLNNVNPTTGTFDDTAASKSRDALIQNTIGNVMSLKEKKDLMTPTYPAVAAGGSTVVGQGPSYNPEKGWHEPIAPGAPGSTVITGALPAGTPFMGHDTNNNPVPSVTQTGAPPVITTLNADGKTFPHIPPGSGGGANTAAAPHQGGGPWAPTGLPTGTPLGSAEDIQAAQKEALAVRQSDTDPVKGYAQTSQVYKDVMQLVHDHPEGLGPGSAGWNKLRTVLTPLGANSNASVQDINSFLERLATSNATQAGLNTDSGRAMASAATGSTDMNPAALTTKLRFGAATLEAGHAYRQGMDMAIGTGANQNFGNKRQFDSDWTANADPVAFRLMSAKTNGDKEDYSATLNGLSSGDAAKVVGHYKNLQSLMTTGKLPPPPQKTAQAETPWYGTA